MGGERERKEFSKVITAIVVVTFSLMAAGFIIFVCYEMHRQEDLSPVGFIGVPIIMIIAAVLKFYLKRAEAKSLTDLQWEMTRQETLFREKHPEYFIRGRIQTLDDGYDDLTQSYNDMTGGNG